VQSGLADVIIETALTRDVQILVESHSEHLLTRLQRRLAEADLARGLRLTPSDVALYFCDQHKGDSESQISRLEIDEFGNISNWPEDFFGNPLEDTVAIVEAAARRASGSEPTL
jgi:predicted ATPase